MTISFARRTWFIGAALAAALAGCSQEATKQTPLSIQTTKVGNANFAPVVEAIAPLEATANVDLKPSIDGRVVKILARDGDAVTAGQVILVLDNVQERAALDAARSEAVKDRLNAQRYEYLYDQGAVSAKDRDKYIAEAMSGEQQATPSSAFQGKMFPLRSTDEFESQLFAETTTLPGC